MWALLVLIMLTVNEVNSAPVPFKDELKTNFNLNDQRLGEVGDLLDQIRVAAEQNYKDRKNPPVAEKRVGEANDSENSGGGGGASLGASVPSIGAGHPNFSLPLAKYLFEGDILLSPVQASSILHKLLMDNIAGGRSRRTVISSDLTGRWRSFPIRYDIDPAFSQDDRNVIRSALNFWGSNTCLSFSYQPGVNDGDYFNFFPGQGCYSMIGKQSGKQSISLGDGCVQMGIVTHEVGHALGLWHEQSRPDANNYVRIIPGNVINGLLYNFIQRSWSDVLTYNVFYDLGSVMHYSGTSFSVDYEKSTIETVLPGYQRTIGQREHPSFYDVKLMNEAYNCTTACQSQLPCQYGGYPHPDHCERCICPDGLGGQYCDKPADPVNAQCGGVVYVNNEDWTVITSPGYPQPGFVVGQECYWMIRSDPGSRILLQFLTPFQFICAVTCLDYVEIKNDTDDFGTTGMRFCCLTAPSYPIYSQSNEMIIIFRSTYSRDVGFKAQMQQYPPGTRGGVLGTEATDAASSATVSQRSSRTSPTVTTSTSVSTRLSTVSRTSSTSTSTATSTSWTTKSSTTTDDGSGSWNQWTAWSECTRTCGACGVKARSRQCSTTISCYGEKQQYKRCAFDICPGDTLCTRLQFSDQPCGKEKDKICSNAHEVTVKCSFPSCCDPFRPEDGYCRLTSWNTVNNTYDSSWGKWSHWGECLGSPCGGCAIRARIRACEDDSCSGGTDTEYVRCNTQACTNCSNNPGQWIIGDCQNGRKDQCIQPRTSSDIACPCCSPLVNVNGKCVSP